MPTRNLVNLPGLVILGNEDHQKGPPHLSHYLGAACGSAVNLVNLFNPLYTRACTRARTRARAGGSVEVNHVHHVT